MLNFQNTVIKHALAYDYLKGTCDNTNLKLGVFGSTLLKNLKNEWINSFVKKEPNILMSEPYTGVENIKFANGNFGYCNIVKGATRQIESPLQINLEGNLTYSTIFDGNLKEISDVWRTKRLLFWRQFFNQPHYLTNLCVQQSDTNHNEPYTSHCLSFNASGLYNISAKNKNDHDNISFEKLIIKAQKHKTNSFILNLNIVFQSILWVILCDASAPTPLNKISFERASQESCDNSSQTLRLHHKIAPFQTSIIYPTECVALLEYVQKKIHLNSATLFGPWEYSSDDKNNYVPYLNYCDSIGIPYIIHIRKSTLIDGIIGIRNRDTKIEEEIHITEISKYLDTYLNRY